MTRCLEGVADGDPIAGTYLVTGSRMVLHIALVREAPDCAIHFGWDCRVWLTENGVPQAEATNEIHRFDGWSIDAAMFHEMARWLVADYPQRTGEQDGNSTGCRHDGEICQAEDSALARGC